MRKPVQSRPDASARPGHDYWTQAPTKKNDNWTRARAPASPKKPREAPENPRKPKGTQGTPEGPKKPASTKRLSRRHAATRHASQKLPTGQPHTSARPGHDYWTQAPPKRATTGRTRPSKTTIIVHKHQPQRPRRPRMPQETSGNSMRSRQENPGNHKRPQEAPRGPKNPSKQ